MEANSLPMLSSDSSRYEAALERTEHTSLPWHYRICCSRRPRVNEIRAYLDFLQRSRIMATAREVPFSSKHYYPAQGSQEGNLLSPHVPPARYTSISSTVTVFYRPGGRNFGLPE